MDQTTGAGHDDNDLRRITLDRHSHEVNLWLTGLGLLFLAFAPGEVYDSKTGDDENITRKAFSLRLQLLGLSARASKPTLDLILAGYYTESFAVTRGMLEGWARTLYVRLRPHEYVRWYQSDPEGPQAQQRHQEPNLGEIDGVVNVAGGKKDRKLFKEAFLRFRILSMGAHPSGQGITQIYDYEAKKMQLTPAYDPELCLHAFNHAFFAHRVLLDEILGLRVHGEDWISVYSNFLRVTEPFQEAIQPLLAEEAEAVERERRARREARAASRNRHPNEQGTHLASPASVPSPLSGQH